LVISDNQIHTIEPYYEIVAECIRKGCFTEAPVSVTKKTDIANLKFEIISDSSLEVKILIQLV